VAPSRAEALATFVLLPLVLGGPGCSLTLASDAELSGGSSGGAGSSYRATILGDGPVAYWRLGEAVGTTTAHDETGHGHDGTYSTSCALGVPGALLNDGNTAVGFDGSAATVTVPSPQLDFAGHTPFSAEGWLNVAEIGNGYHHAINHESQAGAREGYAVFEEGNGAIDFERFVAGQGFTLHGPIPAPGTWVYVVGTYDTGTLKLYVNGVLAGTLADARSANALADPLYLGSGEVVKFFDGSIDEVAIYDRALTQAQITAHYDASGRH
jgi:hypothetical protein